MPKGIYKRNKNMMTGKHKPWNKGLKGVYKHSEEVLKKLRHDGMLGKKHKPETIIKMRESAKNGNYAFKIGHQTGHTPYHTINGNRTIKNGWYKIGDKEIYFRSRWEANYALYLEWLKSLNQIKEWTFEEDVFVFHKIQFGTRSYRPDFKITNNDGSIHYDEVKGWMDPKSKTKIKRMAKYYPEIKLTIIDGKEYASIKRKVGKMLNFY